MRFPSKEQVERMRLAYPIGTRVELVAMSDPYTTLKPGALGTVDFVDSTGTVFCIWDNGSTLGAVYGEDVIRRVDEGDALRPKQSARRSSPSGQAASRTCSTCRGYSERHLIEGTTSWFSTWKNTHPRTAASL